MSLRDLILHANRIESDRLEILAAQEAESEDVGPAETWPEWTDNWYWTPTGPTEDDVAEMHRQCRLEEMNEAIRHQGDAAHERQQRFGDR
jgi:hypothetical protein